jgi:MFS family permease
MAERTIGAARPRLLTRSFTALLVTQVGFGYAFSSFFLLPKFVVVALAGGPREIGWVTAVHALAIVLVLPLMGAAVDRWGRRGFLTAGALLMAAASLAYAGVDRVGPLLFALRGVQAVAFAMAYAAGSALAVDLAPPARLSQAIGLFGLTFLSMNAFAPVTVELLAAHLGWRAAFGTAALGALLCAGLSLRLREPPLAPDGGDGDGLLRVASRRGTPGVLVVVALVGSAFVSVFAFIQPWAFELGMPRVSSFFAAYAVTAVAVRGGFGHLMDRWGHRRVSLGALCFYVAVVLSVVELAHTGLAAIGVGLGLAHGTFYPAFNAVAVGAAEARERGKLMALFQASFQVGSATAGLWGLLAAARGYPAIFEAASTCLALALALLLVSRAGRPPPAGRPALI